MRVNAQSPVNAAGERARGYGHHPAVHGIIAEERFAEFAIFTNSANLFLRTRGASFHLRRESGFYGLLSRIHGPVSLFKDTQKRNMMLFVILDHTGCNGFSDSDL